jgi:hypothetical protein
MTCRPAINPRKSRERHTARQTRWLRHVRLAVAGNDQAAPIGVVVYREAPPFEVGHRPRRQTHIYNELIAAGWSGANLGRTQAAYARANDLFAGQMRSSSKTFLEPSTPADRLGRRRRLASSVTIKGAPDLPVHTLQRMGFQQSDSCATKTRSRRRSPSDAPLEAEVVSECCITALDDREPVVDRQVRDDVARATDHLGELANQIGE